MAPHSRWFFLSCVRVLLLLGSQLAVHGQDPPTITLGPGRVTGTHEILSGSDIQLFCSATSTSGVAPDISWTRNETILENTPPSHYFRTSSEGTNATSSVLTIEDFQSADDGTYFCSGSIPVNGGGTVAGSSETAVLTAVSFSGGDPNAIELSRDLDESFYDAIADDRVSVALGTQFDPESALSVRRMMRAFAMTPSFRSLDAGSIVWVRDGVSIAGYINGPVTADPRYDLEATATVSRWFTELTISDFQASDAGVYQVIFTNAAASGSEVLTTTPVRLDTDEAATLVRVSPAIIDLLLGEPLLIEVSASGGYSEITWMRNGAPLSGTFVSHDEVYYQATSSMADLGEYSITAAPGGPTVTVVVLEAESCDSEVTVTTRGNYTWLRTAADNEAELECQLGPAAGVAMEAAIGRRRCDTSGEWEDPQLENCITMVALQLQQLQEELDNTGLTEENVAGVNQDLREILDEAGEEDQTEENLQVVASVFNATATLPVEEDTVIDILEVLDTIQAWPEEVVEDMGPDIVEGFEEIVTGFVEQENFTNLTFVGDDLIFAAETTGVEVLVVTGRGFSATREENGTLSTTRMNAGDAEEFLFPEEIATAFLPPSLFEPFVSDAEGVGIFFSLYESPSLLPIARESDSPTTAGDGGAMSQVGSPVVGASVSAGGQTEFRDLRDPVIVVLRLNPALDGNITRRACASFDFNLLGGIGNWTSEGCETNVSEDDPNIVTCSCNHLTNFAVLVDICTRTEGCKVTSAAKVVLKVLSIIGVVLSLLGVVLTITTLLIFKKLRERDVTKFHIQLCIAIFCMLLVFAIGIDRVPPEDLYGGCVAVSVLIHYFTLAAVMWMGAEALLMFQKLVIVFIQITTKYIVIVSFVCWVVPIIPVLIPLGIDRDFMVNRDSASDITFCFIGDRGVFFGAFLTPILIVLLFNLVMMVAVVTVYVRHIRNTMERTKEQMKWKTAFRLLFSITGIMSLFGLTWIFGALTISDASLPFQILFVVFNGFQGFFIFLFLCVFSTDARQLWKELLFSGHYKLIFSPIHRTNIINTGEFSNGGTKKPDIATDNLVLTSLSDRNSQQRVLGAARDQEDPISISADQMPNLGGQSDIRDSPGELEEV